MRTTPLDAWIAGITGGDTQSYQLEKLRETLMAAQNASFYREAYPQYPHSVGSLAELAKIPAIDAGTLRERGSGLVCVSQSDISDVVTLSTSGTTGRPKRVFFTEEDRELTLAYFANGLRTVASPGDTMAILLPCARPGGVGDLISGALERIGVRAVRFGSVAGLNECADALQKNGADAAVGAPVQVLALARFCEAKKIVLNIRSVLLCTDRIPDIAKRELKRIWGCEVYEHYGSTETGFIGAIDCDAHDGYHISENDLLFEVVGAAGDPLPDGVCGELVFTTLTRRGMPLIRYRTGDMSRLIRGSCACGSHIARIAPIAGRVGGEVDMRCGTRLSIADFDETLLSINGVCDFTLTAAPEEDSLCVDVETQRSIGRAQADEIARVISLSGVAAGIAVSINVTELPDALTRRDGKRAIVVNQ